MTKPVKKEKGHGTMTYATTTPLVTSVFNQMFKVSQAIRYVGDLFILFVYGNMLYPTINVNLNSLLCWSDES